MIHRLRTRQRLGYPHAKEIDVADWTQEELTRIARVARSVALAVVRDDDSDPSQAGVEIDVETTLQGLMFFAAGIIGQNTNLKTPRDFRSEAERLGEALKAWVTVDRQAAEVGAERLLDIVGSGIAPDAASSARN